MSRYMDDQARNGLSALQAAVHDLRDYTSSLEYVTTATTVAAGFTTLMGRLANIADNAADELRRLEPHAAGGDDPEADVLSAADAMHSIAQGLRDLQLQTERPLSVAWTRIRHEDAAVAR